MPEISKNKCFGKGNIKHRCTNTEQCFEALLNDLALVIDKVVHQA